MSSMKSPQQELFEKEKIVMKSRQHELSEEEKTINEIFKKCDIKMDEFLISFENYINEYKNNSSQLIESLERKMHSAVIHFLKPALFEIWKTFQKWFEANKIFNHFHEIWAEPLYFTKYIFEEEFQNILKNNFNDNFEFTFKDKEYWKVHSIIANISSALDKFANIFFACNLPITSKKDLNKKEILKRIENIIKSLYFHKINEKINALEKFLDFSFSRQKFLIFNEKISSSTYWNKSHWPKRNDHGHSFFGFSNTISSSTFYFIFVDLYILFRSLWYVEVTNFEIAEAVKNLFSKMSDSEDSLYNLYKSICNSPDSISKLNLLDHLFTFITVKNLGSGIDSANIILDEREI